MLELIKGGYRQSSTYGKIKVTDHCGNTEEFSSVAECAKELGVTSSYIYLALSKGMRCRGCTIERSSDV